jgi:long-chain acyl-CoA synthetase
MKLPGASATANLAADLERRAREVSTRAGLFSSDGRSWTYKELDEEASAAAGALAALGVRKGDRVASYLRNGPELAILLFGAWKLGAVPVSISALYNGRELAQSLAKTQPALLITDDHAPDALVAVPENRPPVRRFDELPATSGGWEPAALADEDETAILFTGGTTGMPKAVSVTFGGVRSSLARLAAVSKGRPGPYDHVPDGVPPNLVALPLFHSGGQHTLLFALHVGRPAVLVERFDVATFTRLQAEYQFDNLFLLPTMLYDLVHADTPPDLSSVRAVLIAGQALSIHLRRQFEERYRIPIVMNYGSTETGHVAGWTAEQMRAGLWKPGSAGIVYDGVEIEIRDDDGHAVGVGETGEICVRSTMPKGYVDDPDATSQLVQDGWVHSGDMGYLTEDRVLFLVGRKRDMIKCGGFQVWPEEIEEELRAHPLVRDARVIGVPDERLGEFPRAVVVRESGEGLSDDEAAAALIAHCRDRLAHFKAPREVRFVAELPRSDAGKVKRHALRDPAGAAS